MGLALTLFHQLATLPTKILTTSKAFGTSQQQTRSMDVGLRRMRTSKDAYSYAVCLQQRKNFQGTYRRDAKKMDDYKYTKAIKIGNSCTHDGDAVGVTFLSNHGHRTHRSLYRELYGLDPIYVRQNKPKQSADTLELYVKTGTTFSCSAKPERESKTRKSGGGAENGVSRIVGPLLRHPRHFPGSCVARELNMQREDVASRWRSLENPNQCQQTDRRYVLAVEAPKFISLLVRHVPLQDYQSVVRMDIH